MFFNIKLHSEGKFLYLSFLLAIKNPIFLSFEKMLKMDSAGETSDSAFNPIKFRDSRPLQSDYLTIN
jgi:hypothetical protein